jgi:hypothetical protein
MFDVFHRTFAILYSRIHAPPILACFSQTAYPSIHCIRSIPLFFQKSFFPGLARRFLPRFRPVIIISINVGNSFINARSLNRSRILAG